MCSGQGDRRGNLGRHGPGNRSGVWFSHLGEGAERDAAAQRLPAGTPREWHAGADGPGRRQRGFRALKAPQATRARRRRNCLPSSTPPIRTVGPERGVVVHSQRDGVVHDRVQQPIGNCAWVATPGGRNGGTSSIDNRIVPLSGNAVTNTVQTRTGLMGSATDMTFNVAILCSHPTPGLAANPVHVMGAAGFEPATSRV